MVTGDRRRVVVIGGGLSGLATGWFLYRDHPELDVVVMEATDRLGGKIHTRDLAGMPFDVGADAFLARQPEFGDLCHELGLGSELVSPMSGQVWIWLHGELRRLPSGTVLGIPGDAAALEAADLLTPEGLSRAQGEVYLGVPTLGPNDDPPIAEFVAERYGREVVERLVEPLLAGVYAGDTNHLGLRSAAPAIAALADDAIRNGVSMTEMSHLRRKTAAHDAGPVFQTVRGGLGQVVEALERRITVQRNAPVEHVHAVGGQWQLDGQPVDGIVLATPAHVTARIVSVGAPKLSGLLDKIHHAGATVVSMALPAETELPEGSGMLVPPGERRLIKAVTWSSRKWPHLAERPHVLLRCSMGRINDKRHELLSDSDVLRVAAEELAEALGVAIMPLDAHVQRWPRGLPQYDVGHAALVREIHAEAASRGLVLTGAAYDGVGLPSCVRQAAIAARTIAERVSGG